MEKVNLFDHQIKGAEFLKKTKRALLADEMGLGKSRQAIVAAITTSLKTLVVCPASLKINWQREILIVNPEAKIHILNGEEIPYNAEWLVVNYDTLEKHLAKIQAIGYQCVILDEAHYIKNTSSKRTKIATKLCLEADQVYMLTGTPLLNRPIELFSLLRALRHPLGQNWIYYIRRYCHAWQRRNPYTGRSFWDASGASNIPELHQRISGVMLRREKKNVLNLPEKIRSDIYIELDDEWRKKYETAWDSYLAFLEENPPENMDSIIQARHLVELQKMKQVCSLSKVGQIVEDIKNIVEEQGEKVVVFTQYKETLNQIRSAFSRKRIYKVVTLSGEDNQTARQEAIDSFQNDPATKIFIGNIKAAGVGITLNSANKVLFADLEWTPALHAQAEDRCHRIGQGNMVNVYYYIAKDTLEEDVIELLEIKEKVIAHIIEGSKIKGKQGRNMIEELAKRLGNKRIS